MALKEPFGKHEVPTENGKSARWFVALAITTMPLLATMEAADFTEAEQLDPAATSRLRQHQADLEEFASPSARSRPTRRATRRKPAMARVACEGADPRATVGRDVEAEVLGGLVIRLAAFHLCALQPARFSRSA